MDTYQLIVTCGSGIEAIVGEELRDLGYETQVENGRVRFEGTMEDIARANYWLRTADRVKIIVGEFKATEFDELFEKVKALPWEDYLPLDAEFPVRGRSHKSKLFSVSDVQAITKKAIVDKISETYHKRGMLPETGALFPLEVSLLKDKALLLLDSTGPSLFKRGYRVSKGLAPLKENLAATLIKLTNWRPDMPFHDPTTGSGTLPIEAALIGHNIAPGFRRNFQFEEWPWVDENIMNKVIEEAEDLADYDIKLDITGTDIDHGMIESAVENARQAGLSQSISFKQMQVSDFTTDKTNGVMVSNPPYGERINEKKEVQDLYREMGEVFRPHETWSKYILTSYLDFESLYGEKATKVRKLYNGSIRTDYFQFWATKR